MDSNITSNFLGPKGENASEFENLILEVLRDHVYWRRNFHPEDIRLITEQAKLDSSENISKLKDSLFQILSELKKGAPLYSPRQIAHIVTDPTISALVGYFAGMLYNQNNVVAEVSPETVRKERSYMSALSKMLGYPVFIPEKLDVGSNLDAKYSWGHLCSGGTSANIEALWLARNIKYFPLSIKILACSNKKIGSINFNEFEVSLPNGQREKIKELSAYQLFNLTTAEIIKLHDEIIFLLKKQDADPQTNKFQFPNIQSLGLFDFSIMYKEKTGEKCPRPVVLVSQTAHYCWKKAMDILGLGTNNLTNVPVDTRIRMDVKELEALIDNYHKKLTPVLAVVSICGTTEEAAIDPLDEISDLLNKYESEKGISIWHHSDAALGGYFATLLRNSDGKLIEYEKLKENLISEQVYKSISALSIVDSVVIDPHKFGYIPYPGGAVLFKNYKCRDFIAYEAPYLATSDNVGFGGFLGKWTLEGSRSGASAISCYLTQETFPLNSNGHGKIIESCIVSTNKIVSDLKQRFRNPDSWIKLIPFTEPDTTGFCFILFPNSGINTIKDLNTYSNKIWQNLTVKTDDSEAANQYSFLISKTGVEIKNYKHILKNLFREDEIDLERTGGEKELTLLRIFIMNPFIIDWQEFSGLFSERLFTVAEQMFPEAVLEMYKRKNRRRFNILIVEDANELVSQVLFNESYSSFLNIEHISDKNDFFSTKINTEKYDKFIIDLKLSQFTFNVDGLKILYWLIMKAQVPVNKIVVYSNYVNDESIKKELSNLGLPEKNILSKGSIEKSITFLMQKVCLS